MADSLRLSVVLATFNRAAILRNTLQCLIDQDLENKSRIELIVIDDASPDSTSEVVDQAAKRAPFRLTYLRNEQNRGPGYTQNRGLREAQAPLVLLMADDIQMSPQALRSHIAAHERFSDPRVAVLGRVVQSPELNQSHFLRTWDPFRFSAFSGQTELPYYRFWACNISAKRDFLLSCGGFCEQPGRGGAAMHEDPELGYRLGQAGLRIIYEPEALGLHYHLVSFEAACRRKYQTGINFGQFREYVPTPELPVAYHVLNRHTLRDHLRTYMGPARQLLPVEERNPLKLLARHLLRATAFNRITLPFFWEPLARAAESRESLRPLVNSSVLRGILFEHFMRGCRDGDRQFGPPKLTRWITEGSARST